MTVTSPTARADYEGNGVTTDFPVTFRFLENAHLKVIRTVIATGITTTLSLDAMGANGYTVAGAGQPPGGLVTTNVAPAIGDRLSILRSVPITQEIDYIANDPFPAESHERGLDKLTMIVQQQGEVVERAVVLPPQTVGVSNELPGPQALYLLRWKADLTGLENALPPEIATVAPGAVVDATVSPIAGIQGTKLNFLQAGTGAVNRNVQAKMREVVSITDYYLATDGANWNPAFSRALAYLGSVGGGRLYLPAGTYPITGSIDISAYDNIWIDGCGQDNTIITTNSATAPMILSNADRKYRKFTNFTLTSSVTRTGSAHMDFLAERRSIIQDVKITGHYNGIHLRGFEEVEIQRCKIVNPTGAGSAIIAGTFGVFGSGANLHIIGCFIRGNDDIAQNAPTGSTGITAFDCDAIYLIDADIGGFIDNDFAVNSSVRAANFHAVGCYFDATKNGHCMLVQGAGTKQQWSFANCWFASAGKLTGGANDACGLYLADQGAYASIMFTACRFYSNKGSGVYQGKAGSTQFVGCNFEQNGSGGSGNQYGFKFSPSAAVGPGPLIGDSVFVGNTPAGIQTTANAREAVINGVSLDNGGSILAGTVRHAKGYDKNSNQYASASTVTISPFHDFLVINGTTNIGTITATTPGHRITIFFTGILTLVDGSGNLRLAGNFTTAGGSSLTLSCDGAEWIENSRTNT